MRLELLLTCTMLLGATALAAPTTTAPASIPMNKPVAFPTAGLQLALPSGFTQQPLAAANEIMVATRIESGIAGQSVSLMLYVAQKDQTPKSIVTALLEPMKNNLTLRHLKLEKATELTIAGLPAYANYLTYTHRGTKTQAIQLCFLRKFKPADKPPIRLAYVVTMEVATKYSDRLLQTLDAMLRTIRLTDIKAPMQTNIQFEGLDIKDSVHGYSIYIPKGFYAIRTRSGMNIAQNDFLVDGWPNPHITIASMFIPETETAKTCGLKALAFQRDKVGLKVNILNQGPVKLAGQEGYQFVVKKTLVLSDAPTSQPKAETKPATKPTTKPVVKKTPKTISIIEIQRLICVPSPETPDQQRHYVIIFTVQELSPKRAEEFMDAFCKNFTTIKIIKAVEDDDE